MSIVLTMGTFDTLHPGHVHLFEQCRRIAGPDGTVIATVNSDDFVAQYKGRPPIQTQDERLRMVSATRFVDVVAVLGQQDAKPTILTYRPDFIVIGSDWAPPRDYHAQLQIDPDFLAEHDIAVLYLERLNEHSSSNLKERIREA